jgi:TorA maturation chaperone TorD
MTGEHEAVINDLQHTNMRLQEALTEARTEVWQLRQIVAHTSLFIHNCKQPGASWWSTWNELEDMIKDYVDGKIVNRREQ